MQLELQRTVSIHLRARRIGGSQQGTAAFIRMFSRLAAGNKDSRPPQVLPLYHYSLLLEGWIAIASIVLLWFWNPPCTLHLCIVLWPLLLDA